MTKKIVIAGIVAALILGAAAVFAVSASHKRSAAALAALERESMDRLNAGLDIGALSAWQQAYQAALQYELSSLQTEDESRADGDAAGIKYAKAGELKSKTSADEAKAQIDKLSADNRRMAPVVVKDHAASAEAIYALYWFDPSATFLRKAWTPDGLLDICLTAAQARLEAHKRDGAAELGCERTQVPPIAAAPAPAQ